MESTSLYSFIPLLIHTGNINWASIVSAFWWSQETREMNQSLILSSRSFWAGWRRTHVRKRQMYSTEGANPLGGQLPFRLNVIMLIFLSLLFIQLHLYVRISSEVHRRNAKPVGSWLSGHQALRGFSAYKRSIAASPMVSFSWVYISFTP